MNREISQDEVNELTLAFQQMNEDIGRFIIGNEDIIRLIDIAIISGGHMLIEGVPGTAKTTIVKIIAELSGCHFSRVQCAVDTQPADIVGIRTWNAESHEFIQQKGPVFSNIVLIDEINRLPPKSQTAFIEVMSEGQVTIDGETTSLEKPFFAVATQNPYEQEGTFPLIEAQKDRFMFSIQSEYLDGDSELEMIMREHTGHLDLDSYLNSVSRLASPEKILRFIEKTRNVHIEDEIIEYIRDIVVATREHGDLSLGSSSRGSIALIRGAKACAVLQGRFFVIPDDVKFVAGYAFQHRLILNREAEINGITTKQVVQEILESIGVP